MNGDAGDDDERRRIGSLCDVLNGAFAAGLIYMNNSQQRGVGKQSVIASYGKVVEAIGHERSLGDCLLSVKSDVH